MAKKDRQQVITYSIVGKLPGVTVVHSAQYGYQIDPGNGCRLRNPTAEEKKQIKELLKKQEQAQIVEIELKPGIKYLIVYITQVKK